MHTVRFAKVRRSSSFCPERSTGSNRKEYAGIWHLIRSGEDACEGAPESSGLLFVLSAHFLFADDPSRTTMHSIGA